MRRTLDQIALSTGEGGDKDSTRHAYTGRYSELFESIRDSSLKLLEIGIGNGSSMKIWLEYFPKAEIFGVDIDPKPVFDPIRQRSIRGDQTDIFFWKTFLEKYGIGWDIIIDDGSHKTDGISTSFAMLWPALKSGGVYCIEDLRTSYLDGYQVRGWMRQMDFVKDMLDCINYQCKYPDGYADVKYLPGIRDDLGIEWLRFSEELCILKKK